MNLEALKEPFPSDQIEWRIAQCGKNQSGIWGTCLAYVQARAIMDRLDAVVGEMNWYPEYSFIGTSGVICKLSIREPSATPAPESHYWQWVTKEDGAEMTDIESFKGGISGALKRAAVLWGIGRYLYDLESGFIRVVDKSTKGARYGKTKDGDTFYWLPPELPAWALPKGTVDTPPVSALKSGSLNSTAGGQLMSGAPVSPPRVAPEQPGPGDGVQRDTDTYVIRFGKKHNGKTLDDVGPSELRNYIDWMDRAAAASGKPHDARALDLIEHASRYIAAHENLPLEQEG